jgi:predicted transcriptional regulator
MNEENKVVEEELELEEEKKEQKHKVVLPHQKIKGVVPQKKMPKQVFNKKPITRSAGRGR